MRLSERLLPALSVVEACVALILARRRVLAADGDRALSTLPERRVEEITMTPVAETRARRVSRALAAAVRVLPGEYSCLTQSLAAAWMLQRHQVPGALFVGVRRVGTDVIEAHTWVQVGQTIVCGSGVRSFFKVLSVRAVGVHG